MLGACGMVLWAYYIGLVQLFCDSIVFGNALGMGWGAIHTINDMAISHPPCLHVM